MGIIYRKARVEDMRNVAQLHNDIFPDYFLTKLCGERLLASYYSSFFSEGGAFVLSIREPSELIGFCVGYYVPSQARKTFIRKNAWIIGIRLLWLDICMNSTAINRTKWFLKRLLSRNKVVEDMDKLKNNEDADLLSIGVKHEYVGKGIAERLLEAFENELSSRGRKRYTLMVYADNGRARRFYEKHGMTCISSNGNECKYRKNL